jgi:hypothetical protein
LVRVLVTIPHYYPEERAASVGRDAAHGSLAGDPEPRIHALTACITALHQQFGPDQRIIEVASRLAFPANQTTWAQLDIVVCTTGLDHLLPQLPIPPQAFQHHATQCQPELLGFECHAVLRDRFGGYDYYAYLEDDLICRDPWIFAKLAWFQAQMGDALLLQPNRYEVCGLGFVPKAYIDGDLVEEGTSAWQDVNDVPVLNGSFLNWPVAFHRARNPHSGCFFLNARQMAHWAAQPYFLDRCTEFVGPLESAATLGILQTFRIYKPAPQNASFLEIEHFGTAFIGGLRLVVPEGDWA